MSKPSDSRLLDDYLGQPETPQLSDEQLERQLSGPAAPGIAAKPVETPEQTRARLEALIKEKTQSLPDDQGGVVDAAVKNASHGVKVLAPLMAAITKWVDPEKNPEQVEQMMSAALGRIRDDALIVASAFSVEPQDAPAWLVSQIAGQLMPVMVSALERGNGPVLEGSSKYLEPLIHLASVTQSQALPFSGNFGDPQWQLIQALSFATTNVMTEYHAFSYFHSDAAGVAQMVSDHLADRVLDQTLTEVSERWNLNDNERANLGVTLIHHAGKLLASCWAQGMDTALETLKTLPRDQQRHATANGYPLDHVFESFESLYQGIEVSVIGAMRTLAPSREQSTQAKNNHNDRMRM